MATARIEWHCKTCEQARENGEWVVEHNHVVIARVPWLGDGKIDQEMTERVAKALATGFKLA
jgi:hypothetical protein